MSGSGFDLFGESTRLMVNNMLGKRRGTHIPIAAGGVLVTLLVAAMFMGWGSRRQARLALTNKGRETSAAMAHVQVALSAADEIWLDGTSLGSAPIQELDMQPGAHVLMAKQGARTVTQPLMLKAKDNLRVEFQSSRVRILREE
jgi:hypothetical protein